MPKKKNHVYVGPESPDGSVPIFQPVEGGVRVGKIQPLGHGKPVMGELVSLRPREDGDGHWMETVLESPVAGPGGPAMVNSEKYRNGWDSLFGTKIEPGEA